MTKLQRARENYPCAVALKSDFGVIHRAVTYRESMTTEGPQAYMRFSHFTRGCETEERHSIERQCMDIAQALSGMLCRSCWGFEGKS